MSVLSAFAYVHNILKVLNPENQFLITRLIRGSQSLQPSYDLRLPITIHILDKRLLTLFIVTPIVGVCNCSMFCCTLLYVHSSIAIILMGKRELIALLNLSSWCLVMVERLFLAVPRGYLQFVIVVFPDHTHLLFL